METISDRDDVGFSDTSLRLHDTIDDATALTHSVHSDEDEPVVETGLLAENVKEKLLEATASSLDVA